MQKIVDGEVISNSNGIIAEGVKNCTNLVAAMSVKVQYENTKGTMLGIPYKLCTISLQFLEPHIHKGLYLCILL